MFATVLIILIGVFYLASGSKLLKSAIMDGLLELAIARIDGSSSKVDRRDQICLAIMAVLTFTGGIFLVLQSGITTPVLCTCFAFQLVYVFYLSPKFDAETEGLEESKPPLTAVGLYAVLLTTVIAAQYAGHLPSVLAPWGSPEVLGLVGSVAFSGFALWQLRKQPLALTDTLGAMSDLDDGGFDNESPVDLDDVACITLAPDLWSIPITVEYKNGTIRSDCDQFEKSEALDKAILDWSYDYDDAHDMEDEDHKPTWSEAERKAHFEEGEPLAKQLKDELRARGLTHIDVKWMNGTGDVSSV